MSAVPRAATTVAERARVAGFATAAFVSAGVLDRAFGLDQGFELYSQPPREKEIVDQESFSARQASETAALALEWLHALPRERPFFAWVHIFDPHHPWSADARWIAKARGNPYLAEIAATDDAVGTLVAALRASGRLERTTIVVVGDHGEGLGEHGEDAHAYFVFDSTLRVPFIVRRPDRARAAERSDEIVSVVDVAPTLCDALGVPSPADIDGISLWSARAPPERGVYFESFYTYLRYGMAPIAGWVDAHGKYVHMPQPEFYEPALHPRERRSFYDERRADAQHYRARIAEIGARGALDVGLSVQGDAQLLASVRSLGYADAAGALGPLPDPLAPTDRPSPHQRAQELRDCELGQRLFESGQFRESERVLGEVLTCNPANAFALEFRGHALLRMGEFERACATLEEALRQGPDRASVLRALGFVQQRLGRRESAVECWTHAHHLDPSDLAVLKFLLDDALESGDGEAEQRWRAAIKLASGA